MDSKLKPVIERVALATNSKEEAVKAVLYNATAFMRLQMKELNYPSVLFPKLGSFTLMSKRCTEEEKKQLEEFKNNFKK